MVIELFRVFMLMLLVINSLLNLMLFWIVLIRFVFCVVGCGFVLVKVICVVIFSGILVKVWNGVKLVLDVMDSGIFVCGRL